MSPSVPAAGPDEQEPAECPPRGRYRGSTSQGETICFNVVKRGARRSLTGLEFAWTGSCPDSTAGSTFSGFRRVPVRRNGRFEGSSFNSDLTFAGRITGRTARGTLRMQPGRGGCDSGRVRWNARKG